ncbi:MAG: VWA domain-containing protein [Gemmatimonadota bacterium]|nr:VWA domain-containing protein [Gemmatimonadota bacterium]
MRYVTYEQFRGSLLDALNLQGLLDKLSDFLLQSGFAGGYGWNPWDEYGDERDSMEALRDAILRQLIESGKLTPEMIEALRSGGEADPETLAEISQLLDDIIEALVDEGYLRVDSGSAMPDDTHQPLSGPGSVGQAAARSVKFELTEKGLDFLSYRALRSLLGPRGQGVAGSHETAALSTGIEAEAASRPYRFGDTMNLDGPATLLNAIAREGLKFPLDLQYSDLMVHQSPHRSTCATVLMLDCSHSMILYGEDRFTPAKKVALALAHLLRVQFPGDSLKCLLFHDSAEEIPLAELPTAQVGPYHTNTAEGLRLARRMLKGERKDMRQIIMITDGKPSAMTLPNGQIYTNSMGLDRQVLAEAFKEVGACRRENIAINTFMLARDPILVGFVKKMTEICRGKAYFTTPMTLGQYLLLDYMRNKTGKVS